MTEVCHGRIDVETVFAINDFNEVTDGADSRSVHIAKLCLGPQKRIPD
jgi:hypothetical protein